MGLRVTQVTHSTRKRIIWFYIYVHVRIYVYTTKLQFTEGIENGQMKKKRQWDQAERTEMKVFGDLCNVAGMLEK